MFKATVSFKTIAVTCGTPSNASTPTEVIQEESLKSVKLVHPLNASRPIFVNAPYTSSSELQFLNAPSGISSMYSLRIIERTSFPAKALAAIPVTLYELPPFEYNEGMVISVSVPV